MIDLFDRIILKKILKYLPGFFALLGVYKLIIYYKCFGIRIVEYLDFSEVLLSFADSLIFLLFMIIVPCLIFISFFGKSIGQENHERFKNQLELNFKTRIKHDFNENLILVILNVLSIIALFILGHGQWETIIYIIMVPGLGVLFFIIREIRITFWKQYKYSVPGTYINIFYILCIVTIFITSFTITEATEIKRTNIYLGTEIHLEKEILKSDSVTTYIGQTKGYIFLYNKVEKVSISIPRDKVYKLILKRK